MYEETKQYIRRCGPCQRHENINTRDAMPLTNNLQIELFDVCGIDYMGPFPPSKKCEFILVAVDYVSMWVEALPCKHADNISSERMFEDVIFPRFGVPRVVISDGGAHFIDKRFTIYRNMEFVTTSLLLTILRQVAKQRLSTSKSRIFFRKQSMRWERHGRTSYPMHSGHTRQHTRPQLECPHTNWCTGRLATYLLN